VEDAGVTVVLMAEDLQVGAGAVTDVAVVKIEATDY